MIRPEEEDMEDMFVYFVHAMVRGGFWNSRDREDALLAVAEIMDEQHKWRGEFEAWTAAGSPSSWTPEA